jgi:hypothetical protein
MKWGLKAEIYFLHYLNGEHHDMVSLDIVFSRVRENYSASILVPQLELSRKYVTDPKAVVNQKMDKLLSDFWKEVQLDQREYEFVKNAIDTAKQLLVTDGDLLERITTSGEFPLSKSHDYMNVYLVHSSEK